MEGITKYACHFFPSMSEWLACNHKILETLSSCSCTRRLVAFLSCSRGKTRHKHCHIHLHNISWPQHAVQCICHWPHRMSLPWVCPLWQIIIIKICYEDIMQSNIWSLGKSMRDSSSLYLGCHCYLVASSPCSILFPIQTDNYLLTACHSGVMWNASCLSRNRWRAKVPPLGHLYPPVNTMEWRLPDLGWRVWGYRLRRIGFGERRDFNAV